MFVPITSSTVESSTPSPNRSLLTIDLNSDIGEGIDPRIEKTILDLVTSASIACGGHVGDLETMRQTVRAAATVGVRIGAHPSYPDRANFGRVSIEMTGPEIATTVFAQAGALQKIAAKEGTSVAYIKPHGALYNDAAQDPAIGRAVLDAAQRLGLPLMVLAGSPFGGIAGSSAILEGFIDRGYGPEGALLPRSDPLALIADPAQAASQALDLAPKVDSLCVHSDTPGALELVKAARAALQEAGYEITSG